MDDCYFGGHGLYMGAAARTPSMSFGDFLTKTFARWKLSAFGSTLGLDFQANGCHNFYGQCHHFVLTWQCVHACMIFQGYCILLLPLLYLVVTGKLRMPPEHHMPCSQQYAFLLTSRIPHKSTDSTACWARQGVDAQQPFTA